MWPRLVFDHLAVGAGGLPAIPFDLWHASSLGTVTLRLTPNLIGPYWPSHQAGRRHGPGTGQTISMLNWPIHAYTHIIKNLSMHQMLKWKQKTKQNISLLHLILSSNVKSLIIRASFKHSAVGRTQYEIWLRFGLIKQFTSYFIKLTILLRKRRFPNVMMIKDLTF